MITLSYTFELGEKNVHLVALICCAGTADVI